MDEENQPIPTEEATQDKSPDSLIKDLVYIRKLQRAAEGLQIVCVLYYMATITPLHNYRQYLVACGAMCNSVAWLTNKLSINRALRWIPGILTAVCFGFKLATLPLVWRSLLLMPLPFLLPRFLTYEWDFKRVFWTDLRDRLHSINLHIATLVFPLLQSILVWAAMGTETPPGYQWLVALAFATAFSHGLAYVDVARDVIDTMVLSWIGSPPFPSYFWTGWGVVVSGLILGWTGLYTILETKWWTTS